MIAALQLILYTALIGLSVRIYRRSVVSVLAENLDHPRTFNRPAMTLGLMLLAFMLWISGVVGLFTLSAVWGLAGLAAALLSLYLGVPRLKR